MNERNYKARKKTMEDIKSGKAIFTYQPVVLVKWLERQIKKRRWSEKDIALAGEAHIYPDDLISSKDLLSAIKKQVAKK